MPPKSRNVQLAAAQEKIRCYARKTWRFMDAYRKGLTGLEILYAVKKYRSHRQIPEKENIINM